MPILIGFGFLIAAALLLATKADKHAPKMGGELTPIPIVVEATLDDKIMYAAKKYGVDWRLVKAVAMTESSLDPNAKNPNDPSWGLMGITPAVAEDYGLVKDHYNPTDAEIAMLREPQTNLNIGAWLLAKLLKRFPWDGAIQAYNEGPANYDAGKRVPEYLAKVKQHYAELVK